MLLSILIPTIERHSKFLFDLISELTLQIEPYRDEVEILLDRAENDSVGLKRNRLLERAKGKYLAFFDSDDMPTECYIESIMEGINKDVDCCSLTGLIMIDGRPPKKFIHYKDCTHYYEKPDAYHRFPNHLNTIRATIAKQFKFPEINYGEDTDWATQIKKSGLIKTEHTIEPVIYLYKYSSDKTMQEQKVYSQNAEQNFILDYFKGKPSGKFIDIGAYDTFKFSNTRALYERGFKGIFVEPVPKLFQAIFNHYKDDERIKVLNVAIGATTGEIDFYCCEDAVSTSEKDHMQKWADAGVPFEIIKVPQMSVQDFMDEYGTDADFLSIDTEATNIIVFRAIPDWVWQRISMICIEHDNFITEIAIKLQKFGFKVEYINAENIILSK